MYLFRLITLHVTLSPVTPTQQKDLSRDFMPSKIQHFPLPKETELDRPEHRSQPWRAHLKNLARKSHCPET